MYISLVGEVGKMYRVGEEGRGTDKGCHVVSDTHGRWRGEGGDGKRRRAGAEAWRVRDPKNVGCGGRGERDDRFAPMIHPDSADYAQEEVSCIGMEIYIYIYICSNGILERCNILL